MHVAGADRFGAPWPGFIASLPLPNDGPAPAGMQGRSWRRLAGGMRAGGCCRICAGPPTRARSARRTCVPVEAVLARITELAGPAEPPSRIHGDCWSGNVLWSGGRGWLIDPAAHGGHRETDLAMLALFGAPFLDRILAGYAREPRRWRRAGGRGCRCTSCIRCSCTPACSAPVTPSRSPRPPGPRWPQ